MTTPKAPAFSRARLAPGAQGARQAKGALAAPSFPRARLARWALAAQGLHREAAFGRGLRGVRKAIEHLGYVQIDTISVVERAHHHTLFTRVPDYRPEHLDRLQARGEVFEYWFHAAAYLPMRDYRFALPRMHAIRDGERHWFANRDRTLEAEIMARVRAEGPLRTRDLEADDDDRSRRRAAADGAEAQAAGWWNWTPAKRAIEALYFEGSLMAAGREGFAKVYDLPERVLPEGGDTRVPTLDEYAGYLVDTHLRAHGFAEAKEFSYLRRGAPLRQAIRAHLDAAVGSGELVRIRMAEDGGEVFARSDLLDTRPKVEPQVRLLSPFDNSLIQRDRAVRVHAYDYQIECYTKADKRRFGYFCLPIQYGERFVGRADCKAERRAGVLRVQHLHVEREDLDLPEFAAALAPALQAFAAFNGCSAIAVERVSPAAARPHFAALAG